MEVAFHEGQLTPKWQKYGGINLSFVKLRQVARSELLLRASTKFTSTSRAAVRGHHCARFAVRYYQVRVGQNTFWNGQQKEEVNASKQRSTTPKALPTVSILSIQHTSAEVGSLCPAKASLHGYCHICMFFGARPAIQLPVRKASVSISRLACITPLALTSS